MRILMRLSFMIMIASFLVACGPKGENAGADSAEVVSEAAGQEYKVNTDNSTIMWEGVKVTGKHNGTIKVSEGSVSMEDGALTGGSFTIDMKSITDLDLEGDMKASLENHLKGTVEGKEGDFFDVTKYPTATFEITKATKLMNNEDANYVINGNLTLKETTKNVSFRAMVSEDNGKVSVSTPQFTIDRTEWGINFRSTKFFDDLKDKAINDEIGLKIELMAG